MRVKVKSFFMKLVFVFMRLQKYIFFVNNAAFSRVSSFFYAAGRAFCLFRMGADAMRPRTARGAGKFALGVIRIYTQSKWI